MDNGIASNRIATLAAEIRERLERLESELLRYLDAMEVSRTAQLPYYALCYRETLSWRIAELGRDALNCLENEHLVSGTSLARATVETSEALWHLRKKMETAMAQRSRRFWSLSGAFAVGPRIEESRSVLALP
jgi:hypothetical protein